MVAAVAAAIGSFEAGVHLGGGAHVQVEGLEELAHAGEGGGHEGEVHDYLGCDDGVCGVERWVYRGGVAVDEEEAEGGGDCDSVEVLRDGVGCWGDYGEGNLQELHRECSYD